MGRATKGRGRPSIDYTKPLRSDVKTRAKLLKYREMKALANALGVKIVKKNKEEAKELAFALGRAGEKQQVGFVFEKAVLQILKPHRFFISPKLYGESYEKLKNFTFSFLSSYFRGESYKQSYHSLIHHFITILPFVDRVLIIGLLFTPYSTYAENLADLIYDATSGHYSKDQIEIYLHDINLQVDDSFARFMSTLLNLATTNDLPDWVFRLYSVCKLDHNELKHKPGVKISNSMANMIYKLRVEVADLESKNTALERGNAKLSSFCTRLSLRAGRGDAKIKLLESENKQLKKENARLRLEEDKDSDVEMF